MGDTTQLVRTKFEVTDAASAVAQSVGQVFEGLGAKVQSLTNMFNPLNMAIGALGAGLSFQAIMRASSELEDIRINMAQTLTFMGEGGTKFSEAMHNSEVLMQRIVAESGPLPGNAKDYASAMAMSGAVVQRATGDFEKSYDLIKKTTAVSISMGGNAQLASAELNRMLDTTRGMMHQQGDFNMKMMNAFKTLPGHATMTVHEFNKLDVHKRLELVQKAMGQFDDQIDAASHSWTAIKGATESTVQMLTSAATKPLFENAKRALEGINNAILDSKTGKFNELGQTLAGIGNLISNAIVDGIKNAIEVGKQLAGVFQRIGESPVFAKFKGLIDAGLNKGQELKQRFFGGSGMQQGMAVGGVAAAAAGAGPLGVIMAAGLGKFLADTQAVSSVLESMVGIGHALLDVLDPAIRYFAVFGGIVGDVLIAILPPLAGAIFDVVTALVPFLSGLVGIAESLWTKLQPAFHSMFVAVGQLVTSLGKFLGPVITLVGGVLLWLYDKVSGFVVPIFSVLGYMVEGLAKAIKAVIDWLATFVKGINKAAGFDQAAPGSPQAAANSKLDEVAKMLKDATTAPADVSGWFTGGKKPEMPGAHVPEHRGGGGKTHQDFRFSRFEIQQKFAEGFDPDRIAVAFAKDVGRLGEQKIQSGHEPMFAVR